MLIGPGHARLCSSPNAGKWRTGAGRGFAGGFHAPLERVSLSLHLLNIKSLVKAADRDAASPLRFKVDMDRLQQPSTRGLAGRTALGVTGPTSQTVSSANLDAACGCFWFILSSLSVSLGLITCLSYISHDASVDSVLAALCSGTGAAAAFKLRIEVHLTSLDHLRKLPVVRLASFAFRSLTSAPARWRFGW